jgi:hypothetical protein
MNQQLISINQHYKSSVRIDTESSDYKAFIDDFILHGTAINILDTISRDFAGSAQRAYTLTGPYGSGKSTIALYLSSLLSENKGEREYASKKLDNANGSLVDFTSRFNVNLGWKIIKHVCGLEAPANAVLISIYKAFNVDFDIEEIKSFDDERCLVEITLAISTQNVKNDGILFLLDEMGKALDFQSRANKDLHLFQSLADIAQQAKTPVMLIGFLHQSFSDYAKNKDAKAQKEWAKVQGRYRDLGFNPSIDESLILVGDSILKGAKITQQLESKHKELINNVLQSFDVQSRNNKALTKTLPLDPLVSLLLGPISRRRFSQNERSLFGFLASHEKLGFREFLSQNYTEESSNLALYKPELLWDYLHHNLHHLIVTSNDSKAWLEGCDAIHRASQKGGDLHVSITKVIALLTIFGFQHHLHSKRTFITDYFSARGFIKSEIKEAMVDLERWTVLIYRQKHDALFIFQGSDIDIHNMVIERIELVSQGVDWTSVCDIPQNILATAHYHEFGTMRWAKTLLVNKIDHMFIDSLKAEPLTGESFLSFVLPTNSIVAKELSTKKLPYTAIGQADSLDNLKSAAIELIALRQIAKEEEKIKHDLIAKKELENRIKLANQNVENELNQSFRNALWTYQGKKQDSQPLSVVASKIADDIFHASPKVINELVNRSKPSGSANSAIRKLMNAMFESGDKEDLGFDINSFPPEKGIYLSCLKSKGWHCKTNEGFIFPNKWSKESIEANPMMHALWVSGVELIKTSNKMVTLDELYSIWMKPPFGLTSGLCRLYALALLKSLEGQIAFYDFDSTKQFIFIPELDEELITKIYKHPSEAGVRYFEISEIQTHLLDRLAKETIGDIKSGDVVLGIAKHIVKIVHTLPAWVKKTSGENFSLSDDVCGLTMAARLFRNRVIAANDPYKLILEDLLDIFNLDKDAKDVDIKLAHCLKTAIEDLSAQHDMLLSGYKQIIMTNLAADFDIALKDRCDLIVLMAQRPKIKELASRLIDYINGKASFELIVNLAVGAPERNWTDKLLKNGLDELQNLCIQFRRIESFSHISKKGTTQALALITTDSSGQYKEYDSFIKFDLENDNDVKNAVTDVKSTIDHLTREKKVATLTTLLSTFMDPTETDIANG